MSAEDLTSQTLPEALASIASKTPSPGGGAAASIAAGVSAALGEMVVNFTRGKKKYAEHGDLHDAALAEFSEARTTALDLARADAEAYERLNALQKLDENNPARAEAWPGAVAEAIDVPRRTLDLAMRLLRRCDELTGRSNQWLRSDLAIAAAVGEAAAAAAAWNVRINMPLLESDADRDRFRREIEEALSEAGRLRRRIEDACR